MLFYVSTDKLIKVYCYSNKSYMSRVKYYLIFK